MLEMLFVSIGLLVLLALAAGFIFLLYLLIKKLMNQDQSVTPSSDGERPRGRSLKGLADSLSIRSLVIGVLTILMLIPLSMVDGIVQERQGLYRSVLSDIANRWGHQQVLKGPMLVVPYVEKHVVEETVTDKEGEERTKTRVIFKTLNAVALPEDLKIEANIGGQYRYRGIYESLVYTADVSLSGRFERPDVAGLSEHLHRIDWEKAYLILGLSDTKAINEVAPLVWNGEKKSLSPGTRMTNLIDRGFHSPLGLDTDKTIYRFQLKMSMNGSQGFWFAPFGETTHVRVTSSWPHPSFGGSVLPASHDIRDDGFEADWSIPHLARNYPQLWPAPSEQYDLNEFTAGVELFEPVFLYTKVDRAVKYGILFIALTFLTFLIFELTAQTRLHFVQYGLIGVALSLFYLMLLSFAEHISFMRAYGIASAINIGLITAYAAAATRSARRAVIVLALLSALYILLYSLLQLEDYALLMGTLLLLVVVAVLMYVTRNLRATADAE
ncbi:MAG: cell envelope integrity protein CreD [Gammaproteobacteria bacterium]